MKKTSLAIFLLIFSFFCSAQDISGFWKGSLTVPGGCFPENYIELQLTVRGSRIFGDSYHYLDQNNFIKKRCSGSFDSATKTVIVQEDYVTEKKVPEHCTVCIKRYTFLYTKEGNQETLNGGWTGSMAESGMVCSPGTIVLSRIKESFFKEEHVREVKVDTGTLKLSFYDNAQIDGDSITILVNKKVVATHQLLGLKPISLDVVIDYNNRMQEVEMVAENLGSIPPNTALLVITAGKQQHRLYLTSTAEKSAKVRFIYDAKQQE